MPQKHAKNNTASSVFSYWEKGEAAGDGKYGTQKLRLGTDSQQPFGYCFLCVHPSVDPMATPSGHMYCRECIVGYLLAQTQEIKRQRAAYEAQERAEELEGIEEGEKKRAADQSAFVTGQLLLTSPSSTGGGGPGVGPGAGSGTPGLAGSVSGGGVSRGDDQGSTADKGKWKGKGKKRRRVDDLVATGAARSDAPGPYAVGRAKRELSQNVVMKTKEVATEELRETSWWLPQFAPEHLEARVEAPKKRPSSPMSGEPLRAKDLIPVTFTIDVDKKESAGIAGGEAGKGGIICPLTRREIRTQPAVLIKNTGQVMLEEAAKKFALPTMTCPVTGIKFKKKDLVTLVQSATAFSASGQVEVTKYQAALR